MAQLLRDHVGGGLGVQEAIAQDLANGLVGAPVSGFGSGLLGLDGGETAALVGGENLIIALPAIAIFLSKGGDVSRQTLAFDEHEEAVSQFVGGFNGEAAGRAGELVSRGIEL